MEDYSAYVRVCARIFEDFERMHGWYPHREALRDCQYYLNRFRFEGIAFVTTRVNDLRKAVEESLQTGRFVCPQGFALHRDSRLPMFMGAFFRRIYDNEGNLSQDADPDSVKCVRQVCSFLYKLEIPYTKDQLDDAVHKLVETDKSGGSIDLSGQERILSVAAGICYRIFNNFDATDIVPRPGPGATACATPRSSRYEPHVLYNQIHQKYPYYRYFYVNTAHLSDRKTEYLSMPRQSAGPGLVKAVHKDIGGPRLMCMMQNEYMLLQQGLAEKMRDRLEEHWLTKGQVNFTDQTINQEVALESSMTGEYSTLDMSEASNRVFRGVVRAVFGRTPELLACLLALSPEQMELPSGKLHSTEMFAPMGSSLCFPVMSVVHYCLAVAAINVATGRQLRDIAKSVFVYGDDILCRSEDSTHLFESFPNFGMKFNVGKSFYSGNFRESCGVDAFKGLNVTPVRFRKRFLCNGGPKEILSGLEAYDHLTERGYECVAKELKAIFTSMHGVLPHVFRGSCAAGWTTDDPSLVAASLRDFKKRWNPKLQRFEVKVLAFDCKTNVSMLPGWELLYRVLNHVSRKYTSLHDRSAEIALRYEWLPIMSLGRPPSTSPGLVKIQEAFASPDGASWLSDDFRARNCSIRPRYDSHVILFKFMKSKTV